MAGTISIEDLRNYLVRNEIAENHIVYILAMVDTLTKKERYDTISEIKKAIWENGENALLFLNDNSTIQ